MIKLPIMCMESEIVESIDNHDTVIISAETGSGKSTQIPQFLYRHGYQVVVTEPRRIAAISLARYVNECISGDSDKVYAAYHTAFESNKSKESKIIYCTDGLQLARGLSNMENTVLVLDEVHEWNLHVETLIAWIKKFRRDGNRIKVVIMSATLESEELANFFDDGVGSVKTIEVTNGNHYEVNWHETLSVDFDDIIRGILTEKKNALVFLPGKSEISDTIGSIHDIAKTLNNVSYQVLPLHGDLQYEEQKKVWGHFSGGSKIICATNIAQTSITIPDIDVVIDYGTERRVDVVEGVESLHIVSTSQADCKQRAGRSGRTKNGKYYLFRDRVDFKDREEYSSAEISRLNLDKVYLRLASVGLKAEDLEFFHSPSIDNLRDSKKYLLSIGAIIEDDDNTIRVTPDGEIINKIPLSCRSGKLLLEGSRLGILEEMEIITSIMEIGSMVNFRHKVKYLVGERNVNYTDFTTKRQTLLAELDIYNQVRDRKYPDLHKAGINAKNFYAVKRMIDKLKSVVNLENQSYLGDNSIDERIQECVLSGMIDRLYHEKNDIWGGDRYVDIDGNIFNMDNKAPYSTSSEFVVGVPRDIEFNDKHYGIRRHIKVITMSIGIYDEILYKVLKNQVPYDITEEFSYEDAVYDDMQDCVHILKEYKYRGDWLIHSEVVDLTSGDVYDSVREEFDNSNKSKYIAVNGRMVSIETTSDSSRYVVLSVSDILWCHNHGISELTAYDGYKLYIRVYELGRQVSNQKFRNIDKLVSVIMNRLLDEETLKRYHSVGNRITNLEELKSCDVLGMLYIPDLPHIEGHFDSYYLGLGYLDDSHELEVVKYNSVEEYQNGCDEAVRKAFPYFIKKVFTRDMFIFKHAGIKNVLKDAEKDFERFITDVSNEVSFDTEFKGVYECAEFLIEAYNDIVTSYGETPKEVKL